MRTHLCGELRAEHAGETVKLCGWVAHRREHGEHLAFVDLRDRSGVVQCVLDGSVETRSEWVLQVEGQVRRRPAGSENNDIPTGEVELAQCEVTVLSKAETPPFGLDERVAADEHARLRYRYVDLRRKRMQDNLRMRSRVLQALRESMLRQGFCEVETPLLWTPTPEGAREFAVPSRLRRGEFYVLPQSPQIAKQLLMVGGIDRYFQVARCLRDEDLRSDRQFEFTQLDIEASFVSASDVRDAVADAVLAAMRAALDDPGAGVPHDPGAGAPLAGIPGGIEVLSWHDAMDRYGSDKPDLRIGRPLADWTEVFARSEVRALSAPACKALCIPGGANLSRARLDALVDRAKALGAAGLAWFRVGERDPAGKAVLDSPLDKFLTDDQREAIVGEAAAAPGDLRLAVASEWRLACEVMGALRVEPASLPDGTPAGSPAALRGGMPTAARAVTPGSLAYCWVVDFPLFDGVDEEGMPVPAHHPFTMPHPEDIERLSSDPASVRALAYDLVLNGWELGSGSIRVHDPDLQASIFDVLGISEQDAESRFGFLLRALRSGAPPHGGFAVGVDRFVALLAGEESIREVIAFPKTQSGGDPLTDAPKPLDARVLAELGLALRGEPGSGN